jgi:hypothetical protein
MGSISKSLALILIGVIAISCVGLLTVKSVNAQSIPIPEITILYPTNGTVFNVSMGVDSFHLKYTPNNLPLSWIGYSIDGGQNRTAYGAWYNIDQISHDAEGNPSVRVSGVFESDGNHNLTLYANNTSGDWAIPQTVTYIVNINSDTTFTPPSTSSPSPFSTVPSSTSTPMPTINTGPHMPETEPFPTLTVLAIALSIIAVVIASILLYKRSRKGRD